MTSSSIHNPVMLEEALDLLNVEKGKCFLDATVGLGGHAEAILGASDPDGRLLGTDADPDALARSANRLLRFGDRVQLRRAWLDAAPRAATDAGLTPFDGVLCDLGLSSLQLDSSERGFSFQAEGPLDMRLGPSDDAQTVSANQIVNEWTAEELANLIYDYGEERRSRRIARSIVRQRPIETTTQLAHCVVNAVGIRPGARMHPATRVFQAIRLEVNRELERLAAFLAQVRGLLRIGGRLVVIAFHSLEDRIVKQFLREQSSGSEPAFRTLTRRVMRPSRTESERNPRARSARLRAAEAI
ncbi:MAG: 16S rRNA (cytosine(1402)-N(4))-methyltransferase RsmH [Chloroflexi bacterium]|nr:16S rRNA (cytosine(1402)-N(4))-methyltransferase RsmH [Chloroflexota bacterium]MYJ92169.1 16S rRNA (cytosine(1402)-N(4))-methyltransferase RsmH [Chloroflexota bacterium]